MCVRVGVWQRTDADCSLHLFRLISNVKEGHRRCRREPLPSVFCRRRYHQIPQLPSRLDGGVELVTDEGLEVLVRDRLLVISDRLRPLDNAAKRIGVCSDVSITQLYQSLPIRRLTAVLTQDHRAAPVLPLETNTAAREGVASREASMDGHRCKGG